MQLPASAGQLGLARAQQSAAQALWAAPPSLELGHRGDPFASTSGQKETEIAIAWPLLLPGQRSARGASAQAEFGIAEATQRAARLRVAGDVRESAWLVVARQAELRIAEIHSRNLEALAADVARRVEAGDLARADALAARAESLSASAVAADARLRNEAAHARWVLLTGLDSVPVRMESPIEGNTDDHPDLLLARFTAEGARKRLDLVRVARRDPPDLIVRYRQDTPASGLAAQNSVGVAVRFPFSTDDRNQPREASALAEVDVAQAEERRAAARLQSELATARAGVAAAERQVILEESRAALLRERAALIDRSFRAGETALPELLRALAAANQAEGSLARQRAELGLALARTRQSAGRLP